MKEYQTIPFFTEDGEAVDLFVLEETVLSNIRYLLVTDDVDSEQAEAFIMKEIKTENDGTQEVSTYEMVEDDKEMKKKKKVFEALLEDINIIL